MPLHGPRRQAPAADTAPPPPSQTAAVEPMIEHYRQDGIFETADMARAWALYETPEVRFAARQYSNAFSSAKLVLGRRDVPWEDPKPVETPSSPSEEKGFELLASFAGGPVGQIELLDRMGTYFVVTGDMALVGAYDPMRMAESKWAKWDVWSTTEVSWDGQRLKIREHATEDVWQTLPDYVQHFRVWNRHPRKGWLSDSPVLSSLEVLELIGLYDDRLAAEAISRLIGAGVWMIPQGMKLPSLTGEPGTPADFLKVLMEIAKLAVGERRSAAANVPVMVEAAAEDIEAASKGKVNFWSDFDEHLGDLQERAIRRWATGVDLPAETLLGMSQATHWNANLISEDRVQSFVVPSLRRACGNITTGWLRPALAQFSRTDPKLEVWFDPAGIKTRVDTSDEAQWAYDNFLVAGDPAKYAIGLGQIPQPTDDELKRAMLLHMAKAKPELVPDVLRELNIDTKITVAAPAAGSPAGGGKGGGANGNGKPGPQAANAEDKMPSTRSPGRGATLSTGRN